MALPIERSFEAIGIPSHWFPWLILQIDICRQGRTDLLRALIWVGDRLREPCKLLCVFDSKRVILRAFPLRHPYWRDAHPGVNFHVRIPIGACLNRSCAGNQPQHQQQSQQQRYHSFFHCDSSNVRFSPQHKQGDKAGAAKPAAPVFCARSDRPNRAAFPSS